MDIETKRIVRDALTTKMRASTTLAFLFFFFSGVNACSTAQAVQEGSIWTAFFMGAFSLLCWLFAMKDWSDRKEAGEKLEAMDRKEADFPIPVRAPKKDKPDGIDGGGDSGDGGSDGGGD